MTINKLNMRIQISILILFLAQSFLLYATKDESKIGSIQTAAQVIQEKMGSLPSSQLAPNIVNEENPIYKSRIVENFNRSQRQFMNEYNADTEEANKNRQKVFYKSRLKALVIPKNKYDIVNEEDVENTLDAAINAGIEGFTLDVKEKLMDNVIKRNDIVNTKNNIRNTITDKQDLQIYDAYSRIINGQMQASKDGGTIYDDRNIETFNKLFGTDTDYIDIYLGDKAYEKLQGLFEENNITGITDINKYIVDDRIFRVNRDQAGILPIIGKIVYEATDRANSGIGWWFGNQYSRFEISKYDSNGKMISKTLRPSESVGHDAPAAFSRLTAIDAINSYAKIYDDYFSRYNAVKKKYNLDKLNITITNVANKTFAEQKLDELLVSGQIEPEMYNILVNRAREQVNNAVLKAPNWENAKVYIMGDGEVYREVPSNQNPKFRKVLEVAAANNLANIVAVPIGVRSDGTNEYGWRVNINYANKSDRKAITKELDSYGLTNIRSFIVSNIATDVSAEDIMNSDEYRNKYKVNAIMTTRGYDRLLTKRKNPYIGDVTISGLNDNQVKVKFLNEDIILDGESGIEFVKAINDYNNIKKTLQITEIDPNNFTSINNQLSNIAAILSKYSNLDIEDIYDKLTNNIYY